MLMAMRVGSKNSNQTSNHYPLHGRSYCIAGCWMLIAHSGRGIISSISASRCMWIYYLRQLTRNCTNFDYEEPYYSIIQKHVVAY